MADVFKLLDVGVLDFFTFGLEGLFECLELVLFLFDDGSDHLVELSGLQFVSTLNVILLPVVFRFDDFNIAFKLFMQSAQTTVLKGDELIHVDQMVPECHLVLFLGLVEVSIEHL